MGLAVGQSSEQNENPAIVDAVKDKLIVTGFGMEDVGTRAASCQSNARRLAACVPAADFHK